MPNRWFKPNQKRGPANEEDRDKEEPKWIFQGGKKKKTPKVIAISTKWSSPTLSTAISPDAWHFDRTLRSSCPSIFYPSPEAAIRTRHQKLLLGFPEIAAVHFRLRCSFYPGICFLTHLILH
ncbi:unnamed protein product [Caenorhabditis nigoni]